MLNQKRITKKQVEAWQGSDNLSPDALLDLLTELANGEYTIPNFRADILSYEEESNDA
jgi:hypothetical protein